MRRPIVFVGDTPSNKNWNQNVPFVGTISYKRLLEWIWKLNIDISRVEMVNQDSMSQEFIDWCVKRNAIVIGLGVKACTTLQLRRIEHCEMPHPSGRNFKTNSTQWLHMKLRECYIYIHGELDDWAIRVLRSKRVVERRNKKGNNNKKSSSLPSGKRSTLG